MEATLELLKTIVVNHTNLIKRKVNLKTPLNHAKLSMLVEYLNQLQTFNIYYPRLLLILEKPYSYQISFQVQMQIFVNQAYHEIIQTYDLINYIVNSIQSYIYTKKELVEPKLIDLIHFMRLWKTENNEHKRYITILTNNIETIAVKEYVLIFLALSKSTFTTSQYQTRGKTYIDEEIEKFKQCVDEELLEFLKNIMSISFIKVLHQIQSIATRGVLHSFDEDTAVD